MWRRNEISLRTKVRIYESAIRSILLYGCETWPVRVADMRKMEVFDHWCLRILLKIRPLDQISNKEVRRRCRGIAKLDAIIQQRRLRWFGHVIRRPSTDIAKSVLSAKPSRSWRCRKGGQLKTWTDAIKADVESLSLRSVYGVRRWNQQWMNICEGLATDDLYGEE